MRCTNANGRGQQCPNEAKQDRKRCERCLEVKRRYRQSAKSRTLRDARHSKWRAKGIDPDKADAVMETATECAICSAPGPLVLDHNHTTGKIRGALCNRCNLGLGYFSDQPELHLSAVSYLLADVY